MKLVVGVVVQDTAPVRSAPVAMEKMARMQDPVVGTQLNVEHEGQVLHEADPTAVVNVFIGHKLQEPTEPGLNRPTAHCVQVVLPATENVPMPQLEHTDAPGAANAPSPHTSALAVPPEQ